MQRILVAAVMLVSATAFATKDKNEIERFTRKKSEALFSDCGSIRVQDWFKRFDATEKDVESELKKMGPAVFKKMPASSSFVKFVDVVFPQSIPEGVPMRGVYQGCMDEFDRFRKSRNANPFQVCMSAQYEKTKPAILTEFLKCIEKLKR